MGDWYLVVERRDQQAVVQVSDSGILDLLDTCAAGASIGEIAGDQSLDAEGLAKLMLLGWIGRLE